MFRPSVSDQLIGDAYSSCNIWNFVYIPITSHSFEHFSDHNKIPEKGHGNRTIINCFFSHLATRQTWACLIHNPCINRKLNLASTHQNMPWLITCFWPNSVRFTLRASLELHEGQCWAQRDCSLLVWNAKERKFIMSAASSSHNSSYCFLWKIFDYLKRYLYEESSGKKSSRFIKILLGQYLK